MKQLFENVSVIPKYFDNYSKVLEQHYRGVLRKRCSENSKFT